MALLLPALHGRAVTLAQLDGSGSAPAPVAYVAGGGPQQSLWSFPAQGAPAGPRTAIVLIHGGAWIGGSADVFFPLARYFASRGAVAFSINYRLVKKEGGSLEDCVADCHAALGFIRGHAAEYGIDPRRVVVMGDSAGGHLAAALATGGGADELPAAAVLWNPITDLTQGDWIKFVIGGPALDQNASALSPTPAQQKRARELSPLFHVRPGLPPILDMHGLDDKIVPPDQARAFSAAMQSAGNRCELELLPGARHAFIVPKYTAREEMVVQGIRRSDAFLVSLGFLQGTPTLQVSHPPLWIGKYP